jgi:hypothetical protein
MNVRQVKSQNLGFWSGRHDHSAETAAGKESGEHLVTSTTSHHD